jgi:hypothetical protein
MPTSRCRRAPLLLLALLAACADKNPTRPGPSPPDLGLAAFRLTIDVASGRITVDGPRGAAQRAAAMAGAGASLSLVGSEAVALSATPCTWSSIAGNVNKKRCTFQLGVANRLGSTDLVTPTTFPRPPAGTAGILVFPFTAAALGVPGAGAVPSPAWDTAPVNFFNDFGGCPAKPSDCYRSETYPSPLYGGEAAAARAVGFDVDKAAQSVSVYIVVAADLRDNPPQQLTLQATKCATFTEFATGGRTFAAGETVEPTVGTRDTQKSRGLCRFTLPALAGRFIRSATLRMYENETVGSPYTTLGNVVVDHADPNWFTSGHLGSAIFSDPLLHENLGTLSTGPALEYKTVDVTVAVRNDVANGRGTTELRMRFVTESFSGENYVTFDGILGPNPPQLVVLHRAP